MSEQTTGDGTSTEDVSNVAPVTEPDPATDPVPAASVGATDQEKLNAATVNNELADPVQVPVPSDSGPASDALKTTTVPTVADPETGELVNAPATGPETVAYSKKLQAAQGDNYDPAADPLVTSSAVAEGIVVELASQGTSPTLDALRDAVDNADDELHRQQEINHEAQVEADDAESVE